MPRLVGLSMYRIDINFRESAILGLVGAGGIGAFPALDLDPFPALEVLVVVEEVLDLLRRDFRQVLVAVHVIVALGQCV